MTDVLEPQALPPAPLTPTRPLLWSLRRELWENRSIYVAPLVVALVLLFGFAISTIGMPQRRRAVSMLSESQQRAAIEMPYDVAAGMLMMAAFLIGVFYCLDALYGERRDRSILFWKSLPVSDSTTVLAKASIPLVVLPLFTFVVIVTTQLLMLLWSTLILLAGGISPATLWPQLRFIPSPLVAAYAVTAVALWHAPLYGWLLLVSAWARRAVLLWAVLPFFALAALEHITFNSRFVLALMKDRLIGWLTLAFLEHKKGSPHIDPLDAMTPGRFLSTPGLWIGLVFAAAFMAAAVRLRRNREPI